MKNLFTTCFLMLAVLSVQAQNEDYIMTAGLHAGYSLTGSVIKGISESDPSSTVNTTVFPAMQLSFDYGLSKLFSIGVAASYQVVNIDATDYTYFDDEDGMQKTRSFKTKFRRSQFAIRPLLHYGNSDNLDMYSGFRIGLLYRGFTDFEGDNSEELNESIFNSSINPLTGTRFSFGVTAFGFRYYFTDNIGAGFEVNFGAPYIVNAGVSARF